MVILAWLATVLLYGAEPRFLPSEDCAMCHTRIPRPEGSWTEAKEWIGPYSLWRGSMMAQAAIDPYWKARVRFEIERPGADRGAIENLCTRCHAPAQQYTKRTQRARLSLAAIDDLGRDGVTCTVCHQITAEGLGREASFSASFTIGTQNYAFGPHADPFTMPMLHHTGFSPRESRHVLESALCGSCHTVLLRPPSGVVVEQGPFLEWVASDYPSQGFTCQRCHAPRLEDASGGEQAQYIAHRPPGGPFPPTRPRAPFGGHSFAGGNVVMPEFLAGTPEGKDRSAELHGASTKAADRLSRALELRVAPAKNGETVAFSVDIRNLSGHKLPTGFPSRRLWLHVTVVDGRGQRVFESGGWDRATGELSAGAAVQPHYSVITKPEQVQVFETEGADASGAITRSLLATVRHSKDNRILPRGFEVRRLKAVSLDQLDIAPAGVPDDPGFGPGAARTRYEIRNVRDAAGVRVEAVFQTVKPAHIPAFASELSKVARPVVVAVAEAKL